MFARSKRFVAALAMVLGAVACRPRVAQATPVAMLPLYDPYSNSNLYLVGSNSTTWSQTQSLAQAMGGNLVTIHSGAENQFIANNVFQNFSSSGGPNLSNASELYIGLTDPVGLAGTSETASQHAANFIWVDGESATYRGWSSSPPEPDNGNGGPHEYYSAMWGPNASAVTGGQPATTGQWNDSAEEYVGPFTTGFYGLAEVPVPEPVSLGLVGVAGILSLRPRRRSTSRIVRQ